MLKEKRDVKNFPGVPDDEKKQDIMSLVETYGFQTFTNPKKSVDFFNETALFFTDTHLNLQVAFCIKVRM